VRLEAGELQPLDDENIPWKNEKPRPFSAGDEVRYSPSSRGRGLVIMTGLSALEPGKIYRIAKIEKRAYVVLEGFECVSGGGLHFSEFSAVQL
jgi:hypothetical protein